ncbi:MAG: DUF4446 family protein [Chloroflexi bacterium]|nr:DUF4446 family protein [Chloroflexota bacterium]
MAGPVRAPAVDSGPELEDPTIDLRAAIEANTVTLILALAGISILLVILTLLLFRRTRRLSARFEAITRGSEERSLEAILEAHLARVHDVVRELDGVEARTAVIERDLKRTFARVGLVRYNPFEDTGGNQSFALALLDAHGDGFIVSSLHSRNGTRIYAKGVRGGRSDSAVSDEEGEAIRVAMAPMATLPAH